MEMNEILNGLNSCGCGDDESNCGPVCNTGFNNNGCNSGFGGGSWIWILLILFYTCSGSRNRGNGCGHGCECVCKCEKKKDDCCCKQSCGMEKSKGGCSSYLFLLVLLFLCNSNRCGDDGNNGFGGFGNILGCC